MSQPCDVSFLVADMYDSWVNALGLERNVSAPSNGATSWSLHWPRPRHLCSRMYTTHMHLSPSIHTLSLNTDNTSFTTTSHMSVPHPKKVLALTPVPMAHRAPLPGSRITCSRLLGLRQAHTDAKTPAPPVAKAAHPRSLTTAKLENRVLLTTATLPPSSESTPHPRPPGRPSGP